jgi:hypothetical protein
VNQKEKEMSANSFDKEEFAKEVFGEMLDDVIKWIRKELDPDEVFSDEALIDWVTSNKSPEDVFDFEDLEKWAIDNMEIMHR